ncbi:MAG: biopolymer transport protein ExbD [Gammaproteobacteria bacterium]|nr:biopolymer transport protein ExbD [Gammaproteobacteria bacterium]
MAMTVGSSNAGQSYSEINMTPLIDVMLVLLIIFIITLPTQTHAIKIDNPLPGPHQPQPPEVIDLQIDFDGTLLWNKTAVDRTTMQGYISTEATKSPQPEVHITVDKFANYEVVAQTLADLQHRGLKKIGFVNNEFF